MRNPNTQVLASLPGGGIKGLMPCTVLHMLEQRTGALCHEIFTKAAGISTGAILATAMAKGIPMARVQDMYFEKAEDIFYRDLAWRLKSANGLINAKYELDHLVAILQRELGATTLGEAKLPILVGAYDTAVAHDVLFKSWKPEHQGYKLWQVAAASSAAPTFFTPYRTEHHQTGHTMNLIDGGVVANNPCRLLFDEAMKEKGRVDDIRMIDFCTGEFRVRYPSTRRFGTLDWLQKKLTRHNSKTGEGELEQGEATPKGKRTPLFDIMFSGSNDTNSHSVKGYLGNAYLPLNAAFTRKIAMDTTDREELELLAEAGEKLYKKNEEKILKLIG